MSHGPVATDDQPALVAPRTPPVLDIDNEEIFENIGSRMHGPMNGFIRKHFGEHQPVREGHWLVIQAGGKASSRCPFPPAVPSPDEFLHWFFEYTSQEFDGARGSWTTFSSDITPENKSSNDGACLTLNMPPSLGYSAPRDWGSVQVVGEFYPSDCVCYQDGLLRLCRSAHQVFVNQPTLLFLHGFYMRGSLIELWVFDRSGLYCSELFDIQKHFVKFVSIILSYQRMSDQDLGKGNIINTDEGGDYIILDSETTSSLGKLYLESQPIASRERLVGSGTTCYRAKTPYSDRWDYVIKFKWRWARDRPEDELLRLAEKKRV